MKAIVRAVPFVVSIFALAFAFLAMAQNKTKPPATYKELPSEIPTKFKPVTDSFDYTPRNVMIPMRDGVKLHTVILIPSPLSPLSEGEGKGVRGKKEPILLRFSVHEQVGRGWVWRDCVDRD